MIKLVPFTENDFTTLKGWINSEEELVQFAGKIFTYPLSDGQLKEYIAMADKKPFKVVLENTNETIGHCELNFENGNHRLSRILIGKKSRRGQRIGEQIVRNMLAIFFQNPAVQEVDLNVFDWNENAIRCYKNVGFKLNPTHTDTITVNGHTWTKLNMVYKRNT